MSTDNVKRKHLGVLANFIRSYSKAQSDVSKDLAENGAWRPQSSNWSSEGGASAAAGELLLEITVCENVNNPMQGCTRLLSSQLESIYKALEASLSLNMSTNK